MSTIYAAAGLYDRRKPRVYTPYRARVRRTRPALPLAMSTVEWLAVAAFVLVHAAAGLVMAVAR